MNGYQKIKKQLIPILKGLPIIAAVFFLSLLASQMIIRYSNAKYQSTAKIKLDDQTLGFSSNEIYKDFSMFGLEQRIDAEVELLKSPVIVGKAVDSMALAVEVTRLGTFKNTVLYKNCPFRVEFATKNDQRSLRFKIEIGKNERVVLSRNGRKWSGKLNKPILFQNDTVQIVPRKNNYKLSGEYRVRIIPKARIVAEIISKIDVVAPDKETPILRITYVDGNPERAADIANGVAKAYIQDFVATKSSSASATVDFIDSELDKISNSLSQSERKLEAYKTQKRVVNTCQETETGLREISQLRIDMINLQINERAMKDLQGYIDQGRYFDETAVNFGFGDLVLTELVKKLKILRDERIDKMLKYTKDSPQVRAIDEKSEEIKEYIKEAVNRNLEDIEIRKKAIQEKFEVQSHMFDNLPTREKEQRILEREFMINEKVYNFLSEKRIETAILANSMTSFHRIIQPAIAAEVPISPNKTLISFMAGLLGLLGGIGIIYLRKLVSSKVTDRDGIEKNSSIPFAGVIRQDASIEDFEHLFTSLQLKHKLGSGTILGIGSANDREGKHYVGTNLFKAICGFGYSCGFITFDVHTKVSPEPNFFTLDSKSLTIEKRVAEIASQYDFTIFIGPPSTKNILAVKMFEMSTLGLFVLRAGFTGTHYIQEADLIAEEYHLDNIQLVLNSAHKATNYRGNYVGSRFLKGSKQKMSLQQRFRNYYNLYIKRP